MHIYMHNYMYIHTDIQCILEQLSVFLSMADAMQALHAKNQNNKTNNMEKKAKSCSADRDSCLW